jgi:hypothetical protein
MDISEMQYHPDYSPFVYFEHVVRFSYYARHFAIAGNARAAGRWAELAASYANRYWRSLA